MNIISALAVFRACVDFAGILNFPWMDAINQTLFCNVGAFSVPCILDFFFCFSILTQF